MQSDTKKLIKTLAVPIAAGLVAGAVSYVTNGDMDVEIFGITTKAHIATAVAVGGSSFLAESIQNYVQPSVPPQFTSLTKPILTGASAAAIMYAGIGYETSGLYIAFGVGGVSEMVGSYVNDKFIAPSLN